MKVRTLKTSKIHAREPSFKWGLRFLPTLVELRYGQMALLPRCAARLTGRELPSLLVHARDERLRVDIDKIILEAVLDRQVKRGLAGKSETRRTSEWQSHRVGGLALNYTHGLS